MATNLSNRRYQMVKFIRTAKEDPMVTFCRMALDTEYSDIPNNVTKFAKHIIMDTVGNIIGGSAMDGISQVVDMVKEKGGKPESFIPFYGGKVPASEAGMAIGPMSRAMDFAPIHPETMHNSEHTVPSLLAAVGLKKKVTGKEFITAFVLGQEILLRIGIAFRPSIGVTMGRSNGHYIFGSVACVGKLLDLSQEELENAEGIARQMTQPHDMAAFHPVTHMVKVHQGFICQDAINACILAKRGITGPRQEVLTGPRGYLGFAKWETRPRGTYQRPWRSMGDAERGVKAIPRV
jgi:2-methylcitrate dehydratase PrpD